MWCDQSAAVRADLLAVERTNGIPHGCLVVADFYWRGRRRVRSAHIRCGPSTFPAAGSLSSRVVLMTAIIVTLRSPRTRKVVAGPGESHRTDRDALRLALWVAPCSSSWSRRPHRHWGERVRPLDMRLVHRCRAGELPGLADRTGRDGVCGRWAMGAKTHPPGWPRRALCAVTTGGDAYDVRINDHDVEGSARPKRRIRIVCAWKRTTR